MQMGVHVCKIQAHVGQERRNGSSVCEWLEHVQCHDVCYSNPWTAAKRSCAVPVCQSIISRKTPSATHALAVPRGTCPSAVPSMRSQPIKSCRLAPGPSATLISGLGSDRGWADLCTAIARPVLVLGTAQRAVSLARRRCMSRWGGAHREYCLGGADDGDGQSSSHACAEAFHLGLDHSYEREGGEEYKLIAKY